MEMALNLGTECLFTGIKRIVQSMGGTIKGQLERAKATLCFECSYRNGLIKVLKTSQKSLSGRAL